MAVLLSPVGGVAAQFFTNNGVPLSGGKIYTYAAGTSTPQATYTNSSGNIQHSNPIILDAAGRVPTGEIWLVNNETYKFVIQDMDSVLIGTYDNIVGINDVYDAAQIVYTYPDNDAVQETLEARLAQYVSVKDFGAKGDGVTDDTAAIQATLNNVENGSLVYFPAGTYYVTDKITLTKDLILQGSGETGSIILAEHFVAGTDLLEIGPIDETRVGVGIKNIGFQFKNSNTANVISTVSYLSKLSLIDLDIRAYQSNPSIVATGAAIRIGGVGSAVLGGMNDWILVQHCYLALCTYGLWAVGTNIINLRFTQNTTASINNESIFWSTGGQSIIDNNTFQYSTRAATGLSRWYALVFDGKVGGSDVNNITLGPGNSFQANGGGGASYSLPYTWEVLVKDATSMRIIGNQFSGATPLINAGARHAISFVNSNGWVENNTFNGYQRSANGDTDVGACEYDATSTVSHINNIQDDLVLGPPDFTNASVAGAMKTIVSGSIVAEQKSTIPFFKADIVSGITDVSFFRVGNSDVIGKVGYGTGQLGVPAAGQTTITLSWCTALNTRVFVQLANSTASEYLAVTVNDGSFDVKSNVASGSYFFWFAISV